MFLTICVKIILTIIMDIICILNDKINNYIIKNNELVYKSDLLTKDISCKFNKLYNNKEISDNYNNEIIYNLKENSLKIPIDKNIESVILIGNHNNNFCNLFKKILEEFYYEIVSYNFYIHEIKYNGTYDFFLDRQFDINLEKKDNFNKTKIYLDCGDTNFNKKKNEIIQMISKKIANKKDSSYLICTFENCYNKITIYNLSDFENIIDEESNDKISYKQCFTLIDYTYLKSVLFKLNQDKQKVIIASNLMNYFYDDIENKMKIIYNLTKFSPKTFELINMFYNYSNISMNYAIVPYYKNAIKPDEIYKNNKLNYNLIQTYNKSNNILKLIDYTSANVPTSKNSYKIFKKPSSNDLNDYNKNLIKYGNKHKIIPSKTRNLAKSRNFNKPKKIAKLNNPVKNNSSSSEIENYSSDEDDLFEIKKKYPDKNLNKLTCELIKYISEPEDPSKIFDKLMIYNKFMFNHSVKYHIKLQQAHREPDKLKIINNEIISQMKAILIVLLDQINKL